MRNSELEPAWQKKRYTAWIPEPEPWHNHYWYHYWAWVLLSWNGQRFLDQLCSSFVKNTLKFQIHSLITDHLSLKPQDRTMVASNQKPCNHCPIQLLVKHTVNQWVSQHQFVAKVPASVQKQIKWHELSATSTGTSAIQSIHNAHGQEAARDMKTAAKLDSIDEDCSESIRFIYFHVLAQLLGSVLTSKYQSCGAAPISRLPWLCHSRVRGSWLVLCFGFLMAGSPWCFFVVLIAFYKFTRREKTWPPRTPRRPLKKG